MKACRNCGGNDRMPCGKCRPCSARTKQGRKSRLRNWHLQYRYNITSDQFDAMLLAQSGRCAICGACEPRTKSNLFQPDHCHVTGRMRALLCGPCNAGLGMFKDSPMVLDKASAYLRYHAS